MSKRLSRLALLLMPLTLGARTVTVQLYPPEIRLHAKGPGQTILLVATDEEGVSREVTSEAVWRGTRSVVAASISILRGSLTSYQRLAVQIGRGIARPGDLCDERIVSARGQVPALQRARVGANACGNRSNGRLPIGCDACDACDAL